MEMTYKVLNAKKNRENLFTKLLPNSIAILPGAKLQFRSNDVEYPFRQDSNFYYLTKFSEPNAVAVFIKYIDHNKFILFNQEIDPTTTVWDGAVVGQQLAVELFGADESYPITQIDDLLPKLLLGREFLYYPMFNNLDLEAKLGKWCTMGLKSSKRPNNIPRNSMDLLVILNELRLIKSFWELKKIRYVTQISSNAHNHIMQYVAQHKDLTERHVQAEFYSYCLKQGCNDMAYQPIVAVGKNACTLHYAKNTDLLLKSKLLLLDAGAEYDYYAADITRTFPVNGKFSAMQRELYQLVLYAQKQAIKIVKPGMLWTNLQHTIVKYLVQGLVDLKILTGQVEDIIRNQTYRSVYMHGSGHFLGLDVHDPSPNKTNQDLKLVPGMVFTIEPGLYLSDFANIPKKWQGIGIRIEDDLLVTSTGYENLTRSSIKEIADIEYLMKKT